MRYLLPLALVAAISVPAVAQCTLAVSPSGAIQPGSTITAAVASANPDTWTVLAIGENTSPGATSFTLGPLGSLTLDIAMPFIPFPMGPTDSNGDASVSFTVPANIPSSVLPASLSFQAVQVSLSFGMGPPSLNTCVSNVETLEDV